MKRRTKFEPCFVTLVVFSIFLIITGMALLYRVFNNYEKVIIQNADGQLIEFTRYNDQLIQPLKLAAIRLLAYGSMVVLGILFLLFLLLRSEKGSQKVQQEVEILRKKNLAMEELNEQTQRLAHHQRLELMGTLTSGIAHEFNNMLTPIMGYSMLVLEKLPPEDTELYDEVLEIYNTSRKAKNIVARLSDLFRKSSSNVFRPVCLDDLVYKVLGVVKPVWPKNVDVCLDMKCRELQIDGNETQLTQLVLNLVLNGFHAMEENGGILTVATEAENGRIYLDISDNGCGISQEVLQHIFEPFFTTKEAGRGTGLGMAIVRQVVEEHKGEIGIESREGVGTTVTVQFPLAGKRE